MVVKICGIKTLEDALAAADAGADMLGYNFYEKSKRKIEPGICRSIQVELKKRGYGIAGVGIFVNAKPESIQNIYAHCLLDYVQLSGDEPADILKTLGNTAFKALRPKDLDEAKTQIEELPVRPTPPGFLIDAYHASAYGGTGLTGDWAVASSLSKDFDFFLAGGLTPANVAYAIEEVGPWGVDVASGVEQAPGQKDIVKIQKFIYEAKQHS